MTENDIISAIMMGIRKKILPVAAVLALLAGCQREDWREEAFSIPGLDVANTNKVYDAVSRFSGVERASLKFDLEKKLVLLRYDSMLLAKMNIIMAIDEAGVEVEYPDIKKESGKAGYINER